MIMYQNNRQLVRGRDFCSAIIIKIHLIDCFEIIMVLWHRFIVEKDYRVDFLLVYLILERGTEISQHKLQIRGTSVKLFKGFFF